MIRIVGYLAIAISIIVVHDGGMEWAKKQLNKILIKYEIQSSNTIDLRENDSSQQIDDDERGGYRVNIDENGKIATIEF